MRTSASPDPTPENDCEAALQRKRSDKLFRPWSLVLLLGGLILIEFPGVVFGSHSFFVRDFSLFTYPVTWFHRSTFWNWEVPLWNPFNQCGVPFAAQWNTGVFYPGSLIYLLLPLPWSLNIFCLAHLILAGLGMYFLALRWTGSRIGASLAGAAFAWNGFSLNCLMWTSNLAALALMPLVVLWVERAWQEGGRRTIQAALLGGAQMLTGAPEIILLTWVCVAVLGLEVIFRRSASPRTLLIRTGTVAALVTGLAAIQLLPFLDLLIHSNRDGTAANSAWAMPAWGWANFFVPLIRCTPSILGVYSQDDQQWTSSYYVGIGVVAFALLALIRWRKNRIATLGILTLAGVLFAVGPVYDACQRFIPFLGLMRYPIKIVVVTVFAMPLLAAHSFAWLQSDSKQIQYKHLFAVAGFLLCVIGAILVAGHAWSGGADGLPLAVRSGASRAGFLLCILGIAVFNKERQYLALAGLVVLLVALDGMTHTPNQNPTVTTRAYEIGGLDEIVTARLGDSRAMLHPRNQAFLSQAALPDPFLYVTGIRRTLFLDSNLPEKIPTVGGFFSLQLGEMAPILNRLRDPTQPIPTPLAEFLGVSQISSPDDAFEWIQQTYFLPLVTAGQKPCFVSQKESLRNVTALDFDPRRVVYLPEEARNQIKTTNACSALVSLRECGIHRLRAEVKASDQALVVIAQAFYHPWRASVDGKRVRLFRANHAFQAVEMPAGEHSIELVYVDYAFRLGAALSAITLAFCCFQWWRQRARCE